MIMGEVCVGTHFQFEYLMRVLTWAPAIFVKQGRKVLMKY